MKFKGASSMTDLHRRRSKVPHTTRWEEDDDGASVLMVWADSLIRRALMKAAAEEAEFLEMELRERAPVFPSHIEAKEYSSKVYVMVEEFLAEKGLRMGNIILEERKRRRRSSLDVGTTLDKI
jgi:hypothetical protein